MQVGLGVEDLAGEDSALQSCPGQLIGCSRRLPTRGKAMRPDGANLRRGKQFSCALARLSPVNQKRMTSVGMAAGIAAAFNAPIAAVTFTLEELIGTLDQTMLSGVIVAAALAAVVEHGDSRRQPHLPCAASADVHSRQWLVADLVCAARTACGAGFRGVYGFAVVVAQMVPRAEERAGLGAAGDRRRSDGALAVVAILFFHVNGIAGDPTRH